ncbi:MAG: ABC transporter ATP-binding protein [Ruminococcus sp.]|nr:ABC transporter ATP-binding protein [Ruminococcus sp.]
MINKVKPYMGGYVRYTYGALAVMLAGLIAYAVPFFMVYRIIRPLLEGEKLSAGYYAVHTAIIFGCELAYSNLYVLGLKFSHISAYNTLKNIRISLQKKLERQPLGTIQDMGNGKIKKLFTDDIDQVELLLAHAIPEGIANLCMALIAMICMFFADWKLALLSLCSLPLGMFAMGMMFRTGMKRMNDYYSASAKMNSTIIEYVNGMEVVKVFGRDGESYQHYENDIKNYRDFTLAWYKACWGWMALYSAILPCVALVMLPVGTLFVISGISTLADLVLVFCLSLSIGLPLLKALNFAGKFPQLNYKIDEIEKAMDSEPLKSAGNSFNGVSHAVKFENVRFAYKEKEVLHGVTLELGEGTLTALVGESGSGKSTIASVLPRFWDVQSGEILLRGTDIRKMPLAVLMDNISMVFQRVYLFQDTVYNNIALGRPDASREEVIEAAKKARCYDFITELPDGFDTVIGEGGASLSGGQAQRLSIARCILKDSPIVILDEATASVDADNESYIQQAISELCMGKTLLVIAHRLNTIAHADKIIVIKDGQIAESGDHQRLMDKGGIYCSMVTKRAVGVGWRN